MTNKNCRQIPRRRASRDEATSATISGVRCISRDDRDVPACRPVAGAGAAAEMHRPRGPRHDWPTVNRTSPASGRAAGRSTTSRRDCRRARRCRFCRRRRNHGRAALEGRPAGQLPAERRAAHRALSVADRADADAHLFSLRSQHPQLPADLHGWPASSADPDPTWYGHSIGRFEGNTLVVDTVGFNDKFWFDFKGHPHTERLHIVERYTRKDYKTLSTRSRLTIRARTRVRSR